MASHAATFFDGLEVYALDFTESVAWFREGRDPMAASVPIHPSFEDRPGVPDRVFASIDAEAYERQVAAWLALLKETGAPDIYHAHHLTHVNDAIRALDSRPVVAHLHGTELKMLHNIRQRESGGWPHAQEWDRRLVAAAHRADRVIVISPADQQLAVDLLGLDTGLIKIVPNGVDTTAFLRPTLPPRAGWPDGVAGWSTIRRDGTKAESPAPSPTRTTKCTGPL